MTKALSPADIYEKVCEREARYARQGLALALGMRMVEAARQVVRGQSPESLAAFEKLEDEWRALNPKARLRYSSQFRSALGLEISQSTKFIGNTPYNKAWDPHRGFVYGFWSKNYFGLVKLGATTQHPTDRLEGFNRKYALQHVGILFFFEVGYPARVERYWTAYLSDFRRSVGNQGSKEWYELAPNDALHRVRDSIDATAVKRYGTDYVMKNIAVQAEVDFWPVGPKRFGARIVSPRTTDEG